MTEVEGPAFRTFYYAANFNKFLGRFNAAQQIAAFEKQQSAMTQ